MRMIDELQAVGRAKKLEGLLLTNLEVDGGRIDCRNNLLCSLCEWYILECADAFIAPNPIIKEAYPY